MLPKCLKQTGDSIEQVISNVLGHLQAVEMLSLMQPGVSKEFIPQADSGNS